MNQLPPPVATVLHGDCREVMRAMAEQSVHAIITSPPYWMKRKYNDPPAVYGGDAACQHEWSDNGVVKLRGNIGTKVGLTGAPPIVGQDRVDGGSSGDTCNLCGAWRGELGWEPTPQLFVAHLVEVFAECWRVLRDDGLLFVNLMDTRPGGKSGGTGHASKKQTTNVGTQNMPNVKSDVRAKSMALVPERFVIAMQEFGWLKRSTIIWAKGESFNPFRAGATMPESATDRPTDSFEYIFMFSKAPRYYSDMAAVAEAALRSGDAPGGNHKVDASRNDANRDMSKPVAATRNLRSVWTLPPAKLDGDVWRVNTKGTSVKHYATWTPELSKTMIRMSTSEHGACSVCGAPWERIIQKPDQMMQAEPSELDRYGNGSHGVHRKVGQAYQDWRNENPDVTIGWRPTCDHADAPCIPATVLDPFGGSGTTGRSAHALGRHSVCVELKDEYQVIAKKHRPAAYQFPML